jgi:hypothetical protein
MVNFMPYRVSPVRARLNAQDMYEFFKKSDNQTKLRCQSMISTKLNESLSIHLPIVLIQLIAHYLPSPILVCMHMSPRLMLNAYDVSLIPS